MSTMLEEERPVSRTLLPIKINRIFSRGQEAIELEYEGYLATPTGNVKVPYRCRVGDVIRDNGRLASLTVEIMQAYRQLESKMDNYLKERDDAVRKAQLLERAEEKNQQRIRELEARVKRKAKGENNDTGNL